MTEDSEYNVGFKVPDQEVEWETALVPIKEWLSKQAHLPKPSDVEDILLRRFYFSCNQSSERTKKTIDLFFTFRSAMPELFLNRDPLTPDIRRTFETTLLCPLPRKTKENYSVFIYGLDNPDLDLFDFVVSVKAFFMLTEMRLAEGDDISAGEVPIFDVANLTLKFIGKVNLAVVRKTMYYTQEVVPIKLKQIHIINAPSYFDTIFAVFKPFLSAEIANLVKFHEPGSDTLYQYVPQELLPNEYGGKAGSVEQMKRYWIKRVEAKRNWFLANDKNWAVDEALRSTASKNENTEQIDDLPGSFRSLAFD